MALKYWIPGGNGNWNSSTNWSSSSGGASGTTQPTISDDAYFDSASGSGTVTVTVAAIAANIYFTNVLTGDFSGTLNMATTLNCQNNFTLSPDASFNITGSGTLNKSGNGGTLTSNGVVWPNNLTTPNGGGWSTTFGDDWTILGNMVGTANPVVINAVAPRIITIGGNLSSGAGYGCTNITFVLNGTGTLSGSYTTAPRITIDSPLGVITQGGLGFTNCIFTYVQGDYISTGNVSFGGSNTLNNVSGITFLSMSFAAAGGQNITINSDVNTGNLSTAGVSGAINGPSYKVYVSGNLTISAGITGTATIEMVGSSDVNITGGSLATNLIINKSSGATVTATGNFIYGVVNGKTFQLTAGFFNPSTFTVTIPNNVSVTLNGLTFNNLTVNGGFITLTIDSRIYINNNLRLGSNGTISFNGTDGWDCVNLLCSTVGRTFTFKELITYNTTGSVNLLGTNASRIAMVSSSGTNRAIWTLAPSASQSMVYVNGTRIDSSLGQTIWSFGGTLTDTINWNLGSQPQTTAWTFVS